MTFYAIKKGNAAMFQSIMRGTAPVCSGRKEVEKEKCTQAPVVVVVVIMMMIKYYIMIG